MRADLALKARLAEPQRHRGETRDSAASVEPPTGAMEEEESSDETVFILNTRNINCTRGCSAPADV